MHALTTGTIQVERMDGYSCRGFFNGKTTHWHKNGVRVHKESKEWHDPELSQAHIKAVEMLDLNGRITDVFYGGYTDFNETFVCKCYKNEKFDLLIYCNYEPYEATEVTCFWANSKWVFGQMTDHSWTLKERKVDE